MHTHGFYHTKHHTIAQFRNNKSCCKTIAGLSPSSQYRVTVRSKHSRQPGQTPQLPPEEAPGAYTDFRTLTKGLPDPPQVNITNKVVSLPSRPSRRVKKIVF